MQRRDYQKLMYTGNFTHNIYFNVDSLIYTSVGMHGHTYRQVCGLGSTTGLEIGGGPLVCDYTNLSWTTNTMTPAGSP